MAFLKFLLETQILCLYNSETLRQNFFLPLLGKPVFFFGFVLLVAGMYI